jgi:hypothetical protein
MFSSDLVAIDRLRTDAIHVQEPHESGIRKLAEYAAQLQWIGGKFPIDVRDPICLPRRRLADRCTIDRCGLYVVFGAWLQYAQAGDTK